MTFEKAFGRPPGSEPRLYWQPWLGDHVSLRPADMDDVNPAQLVSSYEYAKGDGGA